MNSIYKQLDGKFVAYTVIGDNVKAVHSDCVWAYIVASFSMEPLVLVPIESSAAFWAYYKLIDVYKMHGKWGGAK